jgi:hypothetical protein
MSKNFINNGGWRCVMKRMGGKWRRTLAVSLVVVMTVVGEFFPRRTEANYYDSEIIGTIASVAACAAVVFAFATSRCGGGG